jgi:DNA (cytosine-5)-methyltransferase 1
MKGEMNPIKVVELFAGVGGFRLGLEGYHGLSADSGYELVLPRRYQVVWSNQFEPGSNVQHASDVYRFRWPGSNHSNENINIVANEEKLGIPLHDMLVGGFPCQDYSVANTLKRAGGIVGKKGVLWWDIHRILERLKEENRPTKYLMLENVDRLLKSPVKQRGRDFAIMLSSLRRLGYAVEWRVINAAEYGMPQRRRRVFLLGYHRGTELHEALKRTEAVEWVTSVGPFAKAFPIEDYEAAQLFPQHELHEDPHDVTLHFNAQRPGAASPFRTAGLMVNSDYCSFRVSAPELTPEQCWGAALERYLENGKVPREYYVDEALVLDEKKGWAYHKGAKAKVREDKETGHIYRWSEGGMGLHDRTDRPARTVITSEGGPSPSRSKHLIQTPTGEYRRLTPIELERISMFPEDHTKWGASPSGRPYEISPAKRAFFIGNALVAGVVERLGQSLADAIGG